MHRYLGTAIATLECYKYLSSGIATALVFTDPIWCALIGDPFNAMTICGAALILVAVAILTFENVQK